MSDAKKYKTIHEVRANWSDALNKKKHNTK